MTKPLTQHLSSAYLHAATLAKRAACCVDRQGNIIDFNEELSNYLGYEKEQFPSSLFEIAPTTSLLVWRNYWNTFDEEDCMEEEMTLMTREENLIELQSVSCRVDMMESSFCYLYFESKEVEHLLQQEQTLQAALSLTDRMAAFSVEHAKEMIFWVAKDGTVLYVNKKVSDTMGYSKEELLALKAWEFTELIETEEAWTAFFERVRKEKQVPEETKQFKKEGGVTHINTISTYFNFEGTEYIYGVAFNITKSKLRQRLLEQMEYSLDNTHELVSWIDSKGKFIYVNNKMAAESGYTKTEMLDMSIWDIAVDVEATEWDDIWQSFVEQKALGLKESIQIRKDGTTYPVEVTGNYFTYENIEYIYSRAIDISDRKKKDERLEELVKELEVAKHQIESERNYLQQEITLQNNFNEIISQNKRYKRVLQQVSQVASTPATVLILGETGTGKELVARAIHNLSNRRDRPMIKVNCAALPANLIESELFGHEKGAFTGAYKQKIGRFELADRGTVFLDEIGEMPLDLQAKLLRALQEGEFERLGSNATIKSDVRVIAATNRNLEEMVAQKRFREDLYYRLNVFPIENLPLRDRKDDIPILVRFFLDKFCKNLGRPPLKVSQAAINHLSTYDFPGNIRELENMIERAVILSQGETLNVYAALPQIEQVKKQVGKSFLSFEDMQRHHIREALKRTDWKVTGKESAAELLQINGKTLASKIKKLNISK